MSDLDLVDHLEEDELSENGMVSDLGIVGAVQDGDEHTPDLISFDAHEQFQPRTASNETYLTFKPLSLSQSLLFEKHLLSSALTTPPLITKTLSILLMAPTIRTQLVLFSIAATSLRLLEQYLSRPQLLTSSMECPKTPK